MLAGAPGDWVVPLDLGYLPEPAVSGPLLIQDERRAFVTFNAVHSRPDGRLEDAGTAVVELRGCALTKFGYPNDEALPGHPLFGRGLEAYGIFEVLDSSWARERAEQNRIAFPNTPPGRRVRHFIFTFHDSTLECLALDVALEISREPYPAILRALTERMLGD